MATTLSDIRFKAETDIDDNLSDANVVNWCNQAQMEFMLRVFVPANTTIAINTTDVKYALPENLKSIRQLRLQSVLDRGLNVPYNPVYTIYDGYLQVPYPFDNDDTLLIDYYANLKVFSSVSDEIDLEDRFQNLYISYCKAMYYLLPATRQRMGDKLAMDFYTMQFNDYQMMKKQVTDAYINSIGIQKPGESGW